MCILHDEYCYFGTLYFQSYTVVFFTLVYLVEWMLDLVTYFALFYLKQKQQHL